MTTRHKPVIVYVEDNSGDALLLHEAFIDRDHDVELLTIEKGDKALHYFQVKARARDLPPPHCILLDDHLPMVTGVELVKFIRGSDAFAHTPVFIFAQAQDYADMKSVVDISPDSFLKKPQEWDQFIMLADTLARGAWLSNQAKTPPTNPEPLVAPPEELKQMK